MPTFFALSGKKSAWPKKKLNYVQALKAFCLSIVFHFVCCSMGYAQGNSSTKPNVMVITTGGTIASRVGNAMLEGDELINAIPELSNLANIEVEEIFRIGSSKMKPENWLRLAQFIDSIIVNRKDLEGIVITHGTDTMEETAFFLDLVLESSIPIVFVGSMRSSNEISADGPANLVNAVRVAVDSESIGRGVLVVMNERIAAAKDVQKFDNRNVHTFVSPLFGYLGVVDPDAINYFRKLDKAQKPVIKISIQQIKSLPSVDIVSDFTGFDGSILTYFEGRPTEGLVFASFAGGRTSRGAFEGLQRMGERGNKIIVIASKVPGGRIIGKRLNDDGLVVANHFTPAKSRILLMLCLTFTKDKQTIQMVFDEY